jgi:hypothetical protein
MSDKMKDALTGVAEQLDKSLASEQELKNNVIKIQDFVPDDDMKTLIRKTAMLYPQKGTQEWFVDFVENALVSKANQTFVAKYKREWMTQRDRMKDLGKPYATTLDEYMEQFADAEVMRICKERGK